MADRTIVRTSWVVRSLPILVVLILVAIAVYLVEASPGRWDVTNSTLDASTALLLVAVVLYVGTFLAVTRRIELSDDGVRFVEGFQTTRIRWYDLRPPVESVLLGFRIWSGDKAFVVSKRMAIAILADPRCPKFDIDKATRAALVP